MSKSLQQLAEIYYGKSPHEVLQEDGPVPVIGTGGVYGRASCALFSGPAIVVPRKGTLGNSQFLDQPFWPVDTTYAVLPKREVDARWLFYSLDQFDLTKLNEATGVPSISRDWLYKIRLGDTDYPTQRRIAEILSTIDEAIEQTEALIAKTQAIKAGLMHDLFTRGVLPNGRLRPPCEEAPGLYKESPLGWVPQEWHVLRVRELTSLVTSGSRGWAAFYSIEGALFVRSQNVRMGYLDFSDRQHVVPPPGSEGLRTKLGRRDLLVTITGNNVGNVACVPATWNDDAFVSQHVGLVRFHDPALADLAGDFLVPGSPGNQQLVEAQYGQSKPGLNLANLRDLHLPIPDVAERELIVERLDATVAELKTELTYVALLRALKSGLMADLLTGSVPITSTIEIPEGM